MNANIYVSQRFFHNLSVSSAIICFESHKKIQKEICDSFNDYLGSNHLFTFDQQTRFVQELYVSQARLSSANDSLVQRAHTKLALLKQQLQSMKYPMSPKWVQTLVQLVSERLCCHKQLTLFQRTCWIFRTNESFPHELVNYFRKSDDVEESMKQKTKANMLISVLRTFSKLIWRYISLEYKKLGY